MKKYPKIRRIGHPDTQGVFEDGEVIILEKMDGSNFRFRLDEEGIRFGTRNTKLGTDLEEIGGQYDESSDYISETIEEKQIDELEDEYGDLVFFGENMSKHTIEYNWHDVPPFLGFDIWMADKEKFASFETATRIFDQLGLETVPIVARFDTDEFISENIPGVESSEIEADNLSREDIEFDIPESTYRDGKAEGIVIRNNSSGVKAKLLSDEFTEKHSSSSQREKTDTDTDKLVETYCTDARIRKAIHRLIDEGDWDEPEMSMMEELPLDVIEDIWEEEAREISQNDWEINTKQMRKRVGKKCSSVLREMIF